MGESFDLIVIGGGCNGTGIARDAAMRGLSVLLVEKEDFGSKTTGASSGMIHGGPRYLQADVQTTKRACADAGYIRKIAPHLCWRIPFLYPVPKEDYPGLKGKIYIEFLETYFENYDRFAPLKDSQPHTRLSPEEVFQIEPSLPKNVHGAVTFDEWGIDTIRLCVLNAIAAANYGAVIRNHTEVMKILREGDRVVGVRVRNRLKGVIEDYGGKLIFNAGGPFAPKIAKLAGLTIELRPAKGIHLVFDRRLTNMAVIAKAVDGRQIFINPYQNRTIVGTTDDDFYGDPDDISVSEDEVEYLLQGIETIFPEIRKCRLVSTWRGIRPTLYGKNIYEDALSRNHKIIDHEKEDGLSGIMAMVGGKLASYREMAEEATDLICKKLGIKGQCRTHLVPLPGGDDVPEGESLAAEYRIDAYAGTRLAHRHGSLTKKVLGDASEWERKTLVCQTEPVTEAEVRYVLRHEMAETLNGVARRTHLGTGSCQGMCCAIPGAAIVAEEKDFTAKKSLRVLKDFLQTGWEARRSVLDGVQLVQEEIHQSMFLGVNDLK